MVSVAPAFQMFAPLTAAGREPLGLLAPPVASSLSGGAALAATRLVEIVIKLEPAREIQVSSAFGALSLLS